LLYGELAITNAGTTSVNYAWARPLFWLTGYDLGTSAAYDDAWAASGIQGTWTQTATDWVAGGSAVAGYSAVAVWGWGAAGIPTYGAGLVQTSETSVAFQVNGGGWMLGTGSGVYPGLSINVGYWTSVTGVPIWNAVNASAGAGYPPSLWFPNHPCLSQAAQAFVNGWSESVVF
jgi:hypothetical protein